MANLLIYGATGYTGRLASSHAQALGLSFTLGGRSETKLADLSTELDNIPYCAFKVNDDPSVLASGLKGVQVLINCAGPSIHTAEPLINACIKNGVHYLDFSAELCSYELAGKRDQEAREKGVMLLPGCGGSVAMLGCLALYALERFDSHNPVSIDIALHVAGSMSRGSAITTAGQNMTTECLKRVDGRLDSQDVKDTKDFDFGDGKGPVPCFPVTLPDLITIWKATGVPTIRTYAHASGDTFPDGDLAALAADGPPIEQREANPYHAAAIITSEDGAIKRTVLHTVNGYTFTGIASVEAAKRVVNGELQAGFQTPAGLFGSSFLETIGRSQFIDL